MARVCEEHGHTGDVVGRSGRARNRGFGFPRPTARATCVARRMPRAHEGRDAQWCRRGHRGRACDMATAKWVIARTILRTALTDERQLWAANQAVGSSRAS